MKLDLIFAMCITAMTAVSLHAQHIERDVRPGFLPQTFKKQVSPCPESIRDAKRAAFQDVNALKRKHPTATWPKIRYLLVKRYETCPKTIRQFHMKAARQVMRAAAGAAFQPGHIR